MVTLEIYCALWFLGFSVVHKKLVMGFLSGSSSLNYWRICMNDMTVQLLRKITLSNVPFRCPWTSSRTKPLIPRMLHYTGTITPTTASLLGNSSTYSTGKMGKKQMDNQENPQPCNFSHHCRKAQSERSALMLSQNCSLKIFLLQGRYY